MNEFKVLGAIIALLYVIYETDALPYYLGLISKNFKSQEYLDWKKMAPIPLNYLEYLNFKKSNFWLSLLSCPICMTIWFVALANILCNLHWTNIGYEVILVWVLYPLLRLVIRKIYEYSS